MKTLAEPPKEDIDTLDIPEVIDWSSAERGKFYQPIKKRVMICIDADILVWFKRNNPQYQTAINEALRNHIKTGGRACAK